MDLRRVLEEIAPGSAPAGLAGCRSNGTPSPSCGYDVVLFDGAASPPHAELRDGSAVTVYSASLAERDPQTLVRHLGMSIIRDPSMSLAPFLRRVESARATLLRDSARTHLADAVMCACRSAGAAGDAASCWQKCAALHLADAVLALHGVSPSSHALGVLRGLRGGPGLDAVPHISETLGTERASNTLLHRMMLSVQGLSEMAGAASPYAIRHKTEALLRDSRTVDCYWYLCHAGRDCWARLAGDGAAEGAARTALDASRDGALVRDAAARTRLEADSLLRRMAGAA